MRCDEFEGRLQSVMDRRSAPEKDLALRDHGAVCESCGSLLAGASQLLAGIERSKVAHRMALATDFSAQAVTQASSARRQPKRPWVLLAVAVVGLAASWLLLLLPVPWQQLDPPPPTIVATDPVPIEHPTLAVSVADSPTVEKFSRHNLGQPAVDGAGKTMTAEDYGQIPPEWILAFQRVRLESVDQIAVGFRPLASTLNVAFDALRRTWRGSQGGPPPSPTDSAGKSPQRAIT